MTTQRILIVDDLQENRYLLKALLEGNGFEVFMASEGKEALRLAKATPPNAVVTDLMMPGMDGFSLCRAWMQNDALWRIPLIVYTATYTDEKDRRFILDLGADAFVIKPAEPESLVRTIQQIIAQTTPKTADRQGIGSAEFFERYAERLQSKLTSKIVQLSDTKHMLVDYVTRCEAILDVSTAAIISIDPERRIRAWNFAAERLFGRSQTEVLHQPSTRSSLKAHGRSSTRSSNKRRGRSASSASKPSTSILTVAPLRWKYRSPFWGPISATSGSLPISRRTRLPRRRTGSWNRSSPTRSEWNPSDFWPAG